MKGRCKVFLMVIFISLSVFNYNSVQAQKWVLAGQIPNIGLEPSISVIDENNVWIAGGAPDTPRVFRTTNGGLEWIEVSTNGISQELFCIWAVDPVTAFVGEGIVSSNAKLFKTTNAGLNWEVILQTGNNQGSFSSIMFSSINPMAGAALAERIYITTDGGVNWIQKNPGLSPSQNSLMLIDENFLGYGLKSGTSRVNITTNSGVSWINQNINLTGNIVSGFAYSDDKMTGLASTTQSMPNIARTTNGGITWSPISIDTGLTGKTQIKWISGTNLVYIIGSNGAIKKSTDSGLTWNTLSTAGITDITHFSAKNINNILHGYAVSSSGSVIKMTDTLFVLTGIKNTGTENPSDYKLFQNYPNPFNPSTKIKFQIPESKFVSLKIFNMTGQEVSSLVNSNFSPGTYEVIWNASEFPSGVYYCQLSIDNVKHSMMKMVLIK